MPPTDDLQELKKGYTKLSQSLTQYESQLSSLRELNQELQRARSEAEDRLKSLEMANSELKLELGNSQTALTSLRDTVTALSRSSVQASEALDLLKTTQEKLLAESEAKSTRIASLEAALAGSPPSGALGIDEIGMSIGRQLEKAQDEITNEGKGFRLGRMSMELKGVPSLDGSEVKLGFPQKEELLSSAQSILSQVHYEYLPPFVRVSVESQQGKLPSVTGYTESLARRKLEAEGYYVDTSFEVVSEAKQVGRVVRQDPAAGSDIAAGAVVTITIGKLMESEDQ